MAKDIQGVGLGLAIRFAGSAWAQKYGLAKPAERLAYHSTRNGFKWAGQWLAKRQPKTPLLAAPQQRQLFDLSLSDEQQMIQDSMRAVASDVLRPMALEADQQLSVSAEFFQQCHELGISHLAVPESFGGSACDDGQSVTTSAVLAEALAWGDLSLAYTALAPAAVASAIRRWGSAEQQSTWLPAFVQEAPYQAAIAVQEPHPLFEAHNLSCKAHKTRRGFRLTGVKALVPLGGKAELYLVAARLGGKPRVFIVPADTPGLSFKASPAMGLRCATTGTLTLNKVDVPESHLLGRGEAFDYQAFIDLGQLHWCALATGTAQAALDYLIPYCNEREAFGEPISHRQSVAFALADIAIELESMRLLTWRAAARADAGMSFHREAYLAHTLCAEKAMQIGTQAVQLLGGHGFTKEHPAERWYRDLRALACQTSGLHL
ncbi:acyl-CoA dehydrogenase [Bacterioplanes sanyensis]|uniref:acyl-CoA dehydrogenase family protein n=1 Tax=Bacterioplanes sanyensis TaxID=1249553 RepID=UPI00167AFCA8|nr:acyl-CoA dehydrogenase family protein [Bacterioplanes sanyensis]GGY33819.1 acyl-CoA dehydrogenase [Bacterioplanes sanyensis]